MVDLTWFLYEPHPVNMYLPIGIPCSFKSVVDAQVLRRHGDEFERTAGGYYRAHGRADDTMNLGGIKV